MKWSSVRLGLARSPALAVILPVAVALLAPCGRLRAQQQMDPRQFVEVQLPADSPLELVRVDYGNSRIQRSHNGMLMDLDLVLTLRNRSGKPVEGLALALGYGFGRAGGWNAVSGIRLNPGESYAAAAHMRSEIELPPTRSRSRPVDLPSSLRVRLDSVLFADGTAYGPDQVRALGAMRITQAESARDRRFLQALLREGGSARLLAALEKRAGQGEASGEAVQGGPRTLAGEAAERARALAELADFRVVQFAGAPLEIMAARARVYQGGLADPSLEVRNVSNAVVADFQVAWVLRGAFGSEFRAASLAGATKLTASGFPLPSGALLMWSNPTVLEIGNAAGSILSGRVYLRAVQFADGRIWVPERSALEAAALGPVAGTSPELFRLLSLYRSRGMVAVLSELRQ